MASPCIITFGGKKYTYDKWIELLHNGQLDRFITEGAVSVKPYAGPEVKAEGKPGEAKGEQAPTETGRLSAPDQVLQRNPDGTFSIQSKADIQNFFERVIGLPTPLAALNATLFELRANAWSQATGMPTDAYYQMYLLRDYVKAEKQELGQAVVNGQVVQTRTLPNQLEIVNGFYSPIEKNLMEYGKDKIKAKDWLNVVGKGDEAVFTGVRAFLEGKDPNAMVSKQEILDYMRDNRISVVEVVKGGNVIKKDEAKLREIESQLESMGFTLELDMGGEGNMLIDEDGEIVEYEGNEDAYALVETYNELSDSSFNQYSRVGQSDTKFSQYQLEGGKENYKEVLVTLPISAKGSRGWQDYQDEMMQKGLTLKEADETRRFLRGAPKESIDMLAVEKARQKMGQKFFDNYQDVLLDKERRPVKQTQFKSIHFAEPNILVHLRMNTRTDAEGKKVLFLEEVQSDWGQKGKKEGFKQDFDKNKVSIEWTPEYGTNVKGEKYPLKNSFTILYDGNPISGKIGGYYETDQDALNYAIKVAEKDFERRKETKIPTAPFVMDTNAWTKLGLKVALKEAVAQGVDKIAWTTGEQQNDRYDLSKQINSASAIKNNDGTYNLIVEDKQGNEIDPYSRSGKKVTPSEMEDIVGKDLTQKLIDGANRNKGKEWKKNMPVNPEFYTVSGIDLKIGGKGMKGFYGSIEEGTKGIVGGVAEKVFGQELKTTTIKQGEVSPIYNWTEDSDGIQKVEFNGKEYEFKTDDEAKEFIRKEIKDKVSIQPSIDITPELKAQVQEGLSLFQSDGNIPPDTYFEQKEKALKEALENAKSRLEAKKRALAKRIAKEGQMSMFAEQNPLMADFDASNDVIEQILRPFNGEIMRINAEIRDNELARRSAAIGREQQLKLFQPLKQNEGYRGSWSMTPDRKARIIAATLKANATTFIHEYLGHDYLNDIAQAANGGSLIHKNMLTAAVLEFVKYKKGLYKFDQVMAAISQFDPLNKSALPADLLPIAIEFHEFFAEAAQEFMRDADGYEASRPGNEGQAWVALLRSFRDYLVDLASSLYMNGYRLSEPMRQVFRNAFGEMSDIVFDEADAAQDRAMEVVVQVIEKNIEKDGIDEQPLFQVEAYHGSPYKFEKFTTEKIGTGEGAQAFGWGLYYSSIKEIAENYAKKLVPTTSNKRLSDSGRVNAKNLSKLLISEPFISKGFGGLDIPSRRVMISEMLGVLNQKEVFDSVVGFIPIDMVNMLVGQKVSANTLLNNPSMLIDLLPVDSNHSIPSFIQAMNILAPATAISAAIADGGSFDSKLISNELASAYRTNSFNHFTKIPQPSEFSKSFVYKATLHKGKTPDQYTWLVWDKPVSEILSKVDKNLLAENIVKNSDLFRGLNPKDYVDSQFIQSEVTSIVDAINGSQAYANLSRMLGGDKQASLFLLENGIDGIKYPAESISRGATSDTARGFNYVVFDENAVTIEEVELFQDINKELEDKIAGQIMTWAVSMYQQKTADKFNIIAELRKKLEGKRTDPRWGERQIQVYNAIIDSRAEQIKSLYEPSQGKKFRQTAQTLLEEGTETRPAEYAFEEDVKRILRGEMGEYTPVSLNKMVQDAAAYIEDKKNDLDVVYKVLESFSDVNKFPNWVPIASLYLRELQARNRTLRTQNTPQANQQIQENLVKISKIFDRLLNEATERGRKLNELKAMSLLDPRTLVWIQKKNFKESFKEQNQKLQEDVRALLKSLQEYKEQATEYIQNLVKKTETIESLQNEITSLSERIASLEELRKKNFVGNAFGKELDFLKDEKEVKKVFNDFFGQITKSDDLELFSSAGLTPLQGLFYAVMTPTKKGGANQFKDLGAVYQLLSERLAKKGKAIQLSTAADYYRQMRDLLISEGASPTHFLDNDQVDQRVEELKESSEANIESLRQKLEAKKAALAAKKIKKEKKKDLQAEIEATIKRYANIKNVRNAMIALGEDMKNLAFEEDADIDAVEQQVLDMISNRARSSNVDDAIVDQIRQKVKTLFDNYRKAVWDGVSQSIAKTINERARKALNVTQPAVDTTFSEFVRLLGEKANELYRKQFAEEAANRGVKPKTKTPEESLAFAVRALNDENGMKLWEEAKEATRNRILADDKISPIDKQVALTMLDKFLHNIYDSVLPETDRLKLVRKAMDEAGLLSSTNTVAWTAIWEKSRGDKAKARELVKDKIRQYLPAQSSDNVTDKLIDILMDKYDAYIEERRIKLVDSQLKAMQKGIDKLTQGTKTSRVKRRSFAQKFIRLVNSGFFSDPQSVTPEKARELFAQYLGLTRTPSAQEWAQVEGLAQEIQDAPEGHERDLATEKLSAWFEYYKPGYGAKVKQSVFIANLLGAPTTVIKNTTGWMEVITKAVTAFGKDIVKYRKDLPFSNPLAMPDFNYFKVMLKGFKQGDFLDILRNGGVNQGDNLSITTDPAGFSRVRILEYYQPKNMYQRAKKSLRYVGRIMSAFDAASQRSVSEIAYYQLLKQLTEKSDPSLSPREVAKRAYNAMYSINIEEATTLAKQTFDEMGIIRPDKARLRRMAYQNIRNARKDPSKIEEYEALQEVTNNAALEEAYKSKMLDNVGAATLTGFAIEKAMQGIYEMARKLSVFMYPGNKYKQQEAQAKYEARFNQVRLQVLPFMTGVFNFMEKTLEKVPVYAALKGASQLSYVGYRGRKMKASPDEYSEFDKINQMYLANRAYEHLIRAGLIYAVQAVVSALIMGSADDDDEESTRVIGSETFAKKGFGAKKNIYPENSIVFSNGVALPLGFMGSYGMSLGLQANMRDELKAKNKKWRQEKPTISDYISVLPDVFMRSLGTFLEMGMLEGTNRALRAVTNYDADTWLTGAIINWSVNSNLPWIGLSRQAADTYRELKGQATTPMTFTEKAMRSLGVPSLIFEGKPALDWRGRPLRPMIKNSSGIAGIVGAAKPLQMDEVDKFLDKNDVLLQWKRSSDPDVTTEDDIVRYSFPQEIRYYYRASVSTGWDVAIQRMYYKRNARVLTEREEKNGYTKDDVVAKDMAKMHNAIERYSGNFIKVLSLTQTAREAKDNMEDAKKDIENILMKYQSEADINSGEAEVKAQRQAKNIVNVVKGVILDKPGDYESATAPWYAKPFLNSND